MKLSIRDDGTEASVANFCRLAAGTRHLCDWPAEVIQLPDIEGWRLESNAVCDKRFEAGQWKKGYEDLAFVVLGLSGIAGVVTAFAAAL